MSSKVPVVAEKGLKSPLFSQAIISGGTVYVSGSIGIIPETMQVVEGSVADRTRQALLNIEVVLKEAGSSLQNIVKVGQLWSQMDVGLILKCNIYLTDMADYAAMNKTYVEMLKEPRPARTCVCVKELPFKTDVEIECIAHL